jgi:hypothetical protein
MAQAVDHLPSKSKALSSKPSAVSRLPKKDSREYVEGRLS